MVLKKKNYKKKAKTMEKKEQPKILKFKKNQANNENVEDLNLSSGENK